MLPAQLAFGVVVEPEFVVDAIGFAVVGAAVGAAVGAWVGATVGPPINKNSSRIKIDM